jgi:hypothetical protein
MGRFMGQEWISHQGGSGSNDGANSALNYKEYFYWNN